MYTLYSTLLCARWIHQDAGGRVIVVADNGPGTLQNVGAPDPLVRDRSSALGG